MSTETEMILAKINNELKGLRKNQELLIDALDILEKRFKEMFWQAIEYNKNKAND